MKATICNETLKQKVLEIAETVMGISSNELDLDQDIVTSLNLDSMQLVALSARIERELDIELPLCVQEARTLNDFLDLIQVELDKKG